VNAAPISKNPLADDLDHILAHTHGLWDAVRGETIVITGATGFFGRWLLESFAHANAALGLEAKVIALSRDPARFLATAPHLGPAAGIHFVTGDVRAFTHADARAQLGTALPETCRYMIHAATEASAKLNQENPLLMLDTIVQGTRAALEFALAAGAKRFLLTSSGAVYGRQPSDLTHIPEDYSGGPVCIDPNSAYGEGKRMAELLCGCYQKQHGLEPLVARCFAFVGPFLPLDTHFAIGNFIRDGLQGGPIRIGGDGTPYRSYLYAADLAIWLWTILFKGESMRPFNVGSEQDVTIRELAHIVAGSFPEPPQVLVAREPVPGKSPERYVPATRRASAELNLEPTIPLKKAIALTTAWNRTR
jgi:nucleoside-diphosphate-sugar epimerase